MSNAIIWRLVVVDKGDREASWWARQTVYT